MKQRITIFYRNGKVEQKVIDGGHAGPGDQWFCVEGDGRNVFIPTDLIERATVEVVEVVEDEG